MSSATLDGEGDDGARIWLMAETASFNGSRVTVECLACPACSALGCILSVDVRISHVAVGVRISHTSAGGTGLWLARRSAAAGAKPSYVRRFALRSVAYRAARRVHLLPWSEQSVRRRRARPRAPRRSGAPAVREIAGGRGRASLHRPCGRQLPSSPWSPRLGCGRALGASAGARRRRGSRERRAAGASSSRRDEERRAEGRGSEVARPAGV
eukprot:scaffold21977_cov32-Tisochrysis_lutea.AAC.4